MAFNVRDGGRTVTQVVNLRTASHPRNIHGAAQRHSINRTEQRNGKVSIDSKACRSVRRHRAGEENSERGVRG